MWLLALNVSIPIFVGIVLAAMNARSRARDQTELVFWIATAAYLGVIAAIAFAGASTVDGTHGYGVLGAVVAALPASVPGSILHLILAARTEIAGGDLSLIFAATLVAWSVLNPLVARRIRQSVRRARIARLDLV